MSANPRHGIVGQSLIFRGGNLTNFATFPMLPSSTKVVCDFDRPDVANVTNRYHSTVTIAYRQHG